MKISVCFYSLQKVHQRLWRLVHIVLFIFCSHVYLSAQMTLEPNCSWEDFVNEYVSSSGAEIDEITSKDEIEWLQSLAAHPLQMNRTSRTDLIKLPFLDEVQVDSLLSYRKQKHGIHSLGELQLISGFDYYIRRYMSLFVRFDSTYIFDNHQGYRSQEPKLRKKFYTGTHELESRLDFPFYKRKGYEIPLKPTKSNYFTGNSLHHILRYRYHYKREIAYGVTLEKDPGEPVAKQGFYPYDYLSGYVVWTPEKKPWSMIVGDYEIIDRRGLLFGRDYFAGREQIIRSNAFRSTHFRPHTSSNEIRFFRGAAFTYQKKHWDALLFGSYRQLDARWTVNQDTVRSLQTSGLHRTISEIERCRSLGTFTGGAHLGWGTSSFGLGLDGYMVHYASPVFPETKKYNIYYFRGQTAGGTALSYYFRNKRLMLQGEFAVDHQLHWATEMSTRYRVGPSLSLHAQYRQFSPRFISIYGNAIQQNGRVANEQGLLIGVRYLPLLKWELSGYVDLYQFPKPTYRTILNHAKGIECSIRSRSPLTDYSQLQIRYRFKTRQQTISGYELMEYRSMHRIQIATLWMWHNFELNSQIDGSYAIRQTGKTSRGGMVSLRSKWKLSKRLLLKNFVGYHWSDDYESALHVYEPQLLHAGAFSSFAYHGVRAVALADYHLLKGLTLSCRFSSTRLLNKDKISSGINEITSPWKNDMSFQVRWIF